MARRIHDQAPARHQPGDPSGCSRAYACALLVLLAAACKEADSPAASSLALEPPSRFEELEPAVRGQFTELRARLTQTSRLPGPDNDSERGQTWGELGQWFHVYRYPDSAMRCYREASRLDADDPRWPYYLGMLAVDAGELDQAASAFEAAARRSPSSTAVLIRLAELQLQLRRTERAEAYYRQALELKSDFLAARIGLARLHLQRQDANGALSILQPLLATDERTAGHVHYLMAQAYRLRGEGRRAQQHLDQVPEGANEPPPLGGDDPWLDELMAKNISSNHLTRLGMHAYSSGKFRLAAAHSGRATQLNPDDPELRANYAAALLALGRPRAALEQLESALALNPGLARAYLIKATSHLHLGDRTNARETLLHALELDPGMKEARQQLGRTYQQLGQAELAIEQYAELRTRSGEMRQVRFWHAALLASLGRHDEALTALAEDLADLPDSRELKLLQIRILAAANEQDTRDPGRAAELLARLETVQADVYSAETVAMVAAATGNRELAIDWQTRAVGALKDLSNKDAVHIARRRLALYKDDKACRTPWESGEALITRPVQGLDAQEPST